MTEIVRNLKGGGLIFWCPGCKKAHAVNTSSTGPIWSYNGNAEAPTFSPSVLMMSGHFVPGEEGKHCWCTVEERYPEYAGRNHPVCRRCHSFVRDGQIQFLPDSTHELAGRTVALPAWPHAPGTYGGIEE